MPDPISGAIAGSVAGTAIEQIVNYIENSEDPEEAWRRSALEVAIQAEAFYRQEIIAGHGYDPDRIQRRVNEFGELAQQLAIRGDTRGFNDQFINLLYEFGDGCGNFADHPRGIGDDPSEDWEEMVEPTVSDIKESVDV